MDKIIRQNYEFTINENYNSADDLANTLRKIADLIDEGFTSGYEPYWTVNYSEKDIAPIVNELASQAIKLNPNDPFSESMELVCSSELGDGEADDDIYFDDLVCDEIRKLRGANNGI